jgi:glycine/D-amino acid oxidase-like deaminating enzyme
MKYSFWEKYFIESPSDITIIGSGIVGLSTAISIKEIRPDISIKILERGNLPYGASTKNAGFACFGSVSELLDDINKMGEDVCMDIVKMRFRGLEKLKSRVGLKSLEYQDNGGTELFRKKDEALKDLCISNINYCNQLMGDYLNISGCYEVKSNLSLSWFDKRCIFNPYEGTINPVTMMENLKSKAVQLDISIIYGVHIVEIDSQNHILKCHDHLTINYERLIVCNNGFASQLIPDLPVVPARNQVLMTGIIKDNPLVSAYHVDKGYIYFRQYQGRILLGGGRNINPEEETTSEFGNTSLIQNYLITILEEISPGASWHIEHWWSGILGVGDSKYPIVRWVDEHILVGVRLGGMGVAIGSYLGYTLADNLINNTGHSFSAGDLV